MNHYILFFKYDKNVLFLLKMQEQNTTNIINNKKKSLVTFLLRSKLKSVLIYPVLW